jgi:hypothetical protein
MIGPTHRPCDGGFQYRACPWIKYERMISAGQKTPQDQEQTWGTIVNVSSMPWSVEMDVLKRIVGTFDWSWSRDVTRPVCFCAVCVL